MKDSILKGTGNSRFLKSAVPAGTSWADALAMLQAGTFPIDFNGINNAGFQQVGTPLNKANLLKDATALTLGLTGDATPNDMFDALAHAGDLHVWRKTVVTKDPVPEVPGSYKLGPSEQLIVATRIFGNSRYESYIDGVLASNTISVDLNGVVSLDNPATVKLLNFGKDGITHLDGREAIADYSYFMIPSGADTAVGCNISMSKDTIYYIPASSIYYRSQSNQGSTSSFDAAQLVTGVPGTPAIPAGTTVTYPVSTNRNAYQEGNVAKPAGYTLGDIVSGTFRISAPVDVATVIYYSDSVQVDADGTVKLVGQKYVNLFTGSTDYDNAKYLAGKFIIVERDSMYCDLPNDVVLFIPNDTIITRQNGIFFDRYQPVTGYAAIPANTTIEYLGCLGDKARVQVVSYVGTGTYGKANPCSLTFDFPPKILVRIIVGGLGYPYPNAMQYGYTGAISLDGMTAEYKNYAGLSEQDNDNTSLGKLTDLGKKISWYNTHDAGRQMNSSGLAYTILALG